MKVYLVSDDDCDVAAHVAAPTASKARYIMYLQKTDVLGVSFADCLNDFRIRRAPLMDTADDFVGILPGQDLG